MTTAVLSDEDRHNLLLLVQQVAQAEIGPAVARPEDPPGQSVVAGLLQRLAEVGVLTTGDEPGYGVWDAPGDPAAARLTVEMLAAVAAISPGVAFQVHLCGISAWLDRSSGETSARPHVALDPAPGLSGRATGSALAAVPLSGNDQMVLADAWGQPTASSPRLGFGPRDWSDLWWPQWTSSRGWGLRRTPRDDLVVHELPNPHGLDEAVCQQWHVRPGAPAAGHDVPALDRTALIDAMAAHALGLVAIAVSAAQRSLDRARAYADVRRQGGEPIARHDAVAELLAHAEHAIWTARAALDRLVGLPPGLARLHQAWRARAQLHPLLTAAGSDALQVFGGIGYMRDLGAEKDQRDLNTLRRLGGSPTELTLRCAALDAANGRRS